MLQLQRGKWPNDGPAIVLCLYTNTNTLLCLVLDIEIMPEISCIAFTPY